MALTNAQQAAIAEHLGYPYKGWTINYIQQRLDTIAGLFNAVELEQRIIDILNQLDAIDNARNTYIVTNAGKQIDGGTGNAYFVGRAQADYDRDYNYYRNRLSVNMDMPTYDRLFPTSRTVYGGMNRLLNS